MQTLVPIGTFEGKARRLLGKGKSGGTRIIYYYHNESNPILLLLIYAKATQDSLTDAQKARLKKQLNIIVEGYGYEANDGRKAV